MSPTTLNARALAAYIGISRASLYNQLKDGRFAVPAIPGTAPRRWNIEDVDAWRRAGRDA